MTDILVPTLGESVSTATVARWLKKAGEAVAADEPLVELETDKVTVEVNAPSAGVLEAIAAAEGAEVAPGAVLGVDRRRRRRAAPKPAAPAARAGRAGRAAGRGAARRDRPGRRAGRAAGSAPRAAHAPLPAAAKMMAETGVVRRRDRRRHRQGWPHHQGRRARLPGRAPPPPPPRPPRPSRAARAGSRARSG